MNAAITRFVENEKNVETLFNHMNDGLMMTNTKCEIVAVNPAFERMTGFTMSEVEGQNPHILKSAQTAPDVYEKVYETVLLEGSWTGELLNKRKNGEDFWSDLTITSINDIDGECYFIAIIRDSTERKRQEEKMRELAYHDELTNLPNRLNFKESLQQAIANANRDDRKVAVLFLDVDRFKKINDSYGHDVGDELLIQIGERIQSVISDHGTVSRFGGDEFTICIGNTSDEHANVLISSLFDAFEESSFKIKEHQFFMSVSIGVSYYPEHGQDVDTLLKNADSAMYRTKEDGRNNFQVYEPAMNARTAQKLSLESALIQALKKKELEVFYQLQVDVENGKPFGVEALVRWNHPVDGVLSPAIFLTLAEEIGLLADMDEWVLNEACMQGKKWHDSGFNELIVSVNVSKDFFKRKDFIARIEKALTKSQLEPAYLCLEITEKTAILQAKDIREKLQSLKKQGIHVSLDDFGTGYSSLSQLNLFPIDTLKIDQSFVRGQASKANDAIVKFIIEMAKTLGVSVICEGVETEKQLELIRSEGCHRAQGFYFSKPVPSDDCEKMMREL
ncbi:EAL domain-containing protein [Bacillus suaedae]|uniref:EAL domain-containing protein n=1 Tax=Halalkalibacter suaedae TaxID=2822140 RepID=A0A940WWW5_9BACI|nr:EAL domain-containing protein [Bacillus suaedae]MBP3953183.1 EAL domain-containing protein [Bacillus suaedae]